MKNFSPSLKSFSSKISRRVALAALASAQLMATTAVATTLVLSTVVMTPQIAHAQTGTKTGSWSVNFADSWGTFGWSGNPDKGANGTRTWPGSYDAATNTGTFTGAGGWFSSTWNSTGGNWIPDIGRGGPSTGALSTMATNYNVQWVGTGSITPNNSTYTFGLKFNLATIHGWKDYNMTDSYEAYIVTQTNKTAAQRPGTYFGTVYPPGEPVGNDGLPMGYDCYASPELGFIQLYAWRRENTWSGPVNVQAILKYWADNSGTSFNMNTWYMSTGMTIAPETFDTAGTFRVDRIQIPNLNTALAMPTNLITNPSFDAQNFDTQTPTGWSEWEGNASGASIPATSSYTEGYGGSANGARHGTHYKNAAYKVYTYQIKTGLSNGLYTLRAYAKRGGSQPQTACYLEAVDYGGSKKTVNLPVSSTYQLIEIKDINVTNGQCKIGFWSDAGANNWAYFDDVSFFKQ